MKRPRKPPGALSEQIAAALSRARAPVDPEDDLVFRSRPRFLTRDQLALSDSDSEAGGGSRRAALPALPARPLSDLGAKYGGEPASWARPDTLASTDQPGSDSEEASEDGDESDDYSITHNKSTLDSTEDENSDSKQEENSDESEDDEEGYDISQMEQPPKEQFEHMKKQNTPEEVKKGRCVRNQLVLWEGLLEMRIHLQRCLNTANQMPMPDVYKELKQKGGAEFLSLSNTAKTNVSQVLDKLINLQNLLLKNYPETKNMSSLAKASENIQTKPDSDEEIPSDDEEIPSDTEDEGEKDIIEPKEKKEQDKKESCPPAKKRKLEDLERDLAKTHKALTPFRNSTIQKWNEKTRLTTATAQKNTPTNTVLSQIEYILSDRNKLVRRTQLKRSEYDIVGYKKEEKKENENAEVEINPAMRDRKVDDEYITEIFDDSDFYHQILRELIECKSADISDPVQLSRQWIALQQMRSKMKRKVDTKATKGRRIKYIVHNKLINFMAPEKGSTWSEESTNELYSSLFGKMFENNSVELPQKIAVNNY